MVDIVIEADVSAAKKKKNKPAEDITWPTLLGEEEGVASFQIEFYDGATQKEAVTLTKIDSSTLHGDGDMLAYLLGNTQLVIHIRVQQEDSTYVESDFLSYISAYYDENISKTVVTLVTDLPDGAEVLQCYWWKDCTDWDGVSGSDTTLYQADLDMYYEAWIDTPMNINWRVHQYEAGGGDATTQYGVANTDRWKRKQLHGTYNTVDSPNAEGANDRYDNTPRNSDYQVIPATQTWQLGTDFVNLQVELKSKEDEATPKYQGSPDLVRTKKLKKLKKYSKNEKYGFKANSTPAVRKHLKVSEIGSRSVGQYINYDPDTHVYSYAYDRLEMKTKADPETWKSANLFFHNFDTSDTTNFKVTTEPTYASAAITTKILSLAGKYEVYLMPRKWAYYARSRKGTKTADTLTLTISDSYTCNCGECTPGNCCIARVGAFFSPQGDREIGPWETYAEQISGPPGGISSQCIQIGDTQVFAEWVSTNCSQTLQTSGTLLTTCTGGGSWGPECNPWDPEWLCSDNASRSLTLIHTANIFKIEHEYGIWWDRWPNKWTRAVGGAASEWPQLLMKRNGFYQYLDVDASYYPYSVDEWANFHFKSTETKTEIEVYEGEQLCNYSQFTTISDASGLFFHAPFLISGYSVVQQNKTPAQIKGHHYGVGQIAQKIEDSDFWENYGVDSFITDIEEDDENKFSRWDNIPYGWGLSPAKAGTLCAVIRKKGSETPYFVWRKTDEDFRLTLTSVDNSYTGHVQSFEWVYSLTPTDYKDALYHYEDGGMFADTIAHGEAYTNLWVGSLWADSYYEYGNVEQFYSPNGLREITHAGRAWEPSRTVPWEATGGGCGPCRQEWAAWHFYKITSEPANALYLPIYVMGSKERAIRSDDKHDEDVGPVWGRGYPREQMNRVLRMYVELGAWEWCKESRNNEDPEQEGPYG